MKQAFLLLIVTTLLSCSNDSQNKNASEAQQVATAIKQIQPGGIPTTENGWMMKATINGKQWTATSIIPPDMAGRILGDANQIAIGLPYNRGDIVTGRKTIFSENDATDIFLPDNEGGILGGYKGEMIITKADEQWAEGSFQFFASSSRTRKTANITNGVFRISMAQPQQ